MNKKIKKIILIFIIVVFITSLGFGVVAVLNKNIINLNLNQNKEVSEEEQTKIIAEIGNKSLNTGNVLELEKYIDENIEKLNKDNSSLAIVYFYYCALSNTENSRKLLTSYEDEFMEILQTGVQINSKEFEESIKTDLGKEVYKEIKNNCNKMVYVGQYITIDVNNDYIIDKYGKYIKEDLKDNMKYLSGVYFKYPNSDKEVIPSTAETIYNIEEMIKRNPGSAFIVNWAGSLNELKKYYFLITVTNLLDENKKIKDVYYEGYKKAQETYKDSEIGKETTEFLKKLEDNKLIVDDKLIEENSKILEENMKKYTENTVGTGDMFEQIQSDLNEKINTEENKEN